MLPQLYVLLIRSCPIALIGICHLPLLVMVFLFPPLRGRYCVVNDMEQPLETSVPHLLHLSSQRFESGGQSKNEQHPVDTSWLSQACSRQDLTASGP